MATTRRFESVRTATAVAIALVMVAGALPAPSAAQDFPVSSALSAEARQFDFWVGSWDVNLRVRQPDGSWSDQHRSTAEIYPILGGKAVLELWSENTVQGIKGYSVRYFDVGRNEWVLWLNWPSANRSVITK